MAMRVRHEVPLFCEELSLRPPLRWGGILAVAGLLALGVWSGGWGGAGLQWLSGVCLTLGSAGAVGLWRLSRFETSIGRYGVRAGCWDLAYQFARSDVTSATSQKARSWRSWFASEEVLLEVGGASGSRTVAIPTREPRELLAALQGGS